MGNHEGNKKIAFGECTLNQRTAAAWAPERTHSDIGEEDDALEALQCARETRLPRQQRHFVQQAARVALVGEQQLLQCGAADANLRQRLLHRIHRVRDTCVVHRGGEVRACDFVE